MNFKKIKIKLGFLEDVGCTQATSWSLALLRLKSFVMCKSNSILFFFGNSVKRRRKLMVLRFITILINKMYYLLIFEKERYPVLLLVQIKIIMTSFVHCTIFNEGSYYQGNYTKEVRISAKRAEVEEDLSIFSKLICLLISQWKDIEII